MAVFLAIVIIVGLIALAISVVNGVIAYREGFADGRHAGSWAGVGGNHYDNGYWMPWAYCYDLGYTRGLICVKINVKAKNRKRFKRD